MAEHFRGGDPSHLPNLRDGSAGDPDELPRQRRGITPQMHGRYPDWDVLSQAGHWDDLTRAVVIERVERVPQLRFFDKTERPALMAFCDAVTGQDRDPRIPVLSMVDAKLQAGQLDGFQFAGMPDDREVWRLVARGLDQAAVAAGAASFAAADASEQHRITDRMAQGRLSGGVWERLDVAKAWSVVTRAILAAFYSHPWAWNEIGFGGPAYPRGYAALGVAKTEHWEPSPTLDIDPVPDTRERGLE